MLLARVRHLVVLLSGLAVAACGGESEPAKPSHAVTVKASAGGSVQSTPAGIQCPGDCDEAYAAGAQVTLTPVPAAGYAFAGWSGGACSGVGTCVVNVNVAIDALAEFVPMVRTLDVAIEGSGRIVSAPQGIDCNAHCVARFADGTSVTLQAAAGPGWRFGGWTGACSGTGPCVVALSADQSAMATFTPLTRNLTVSAAGAGSGVVRSTPAGIDCDPDCAEQLSQGTQVTLTALPHGGSTFTGWSGAGCSGTGPCVLTLDADSTLTADFAQISHLLSVAKVGSGNVTATGINCGVDCSETYPHGTIVTLTATAAAGYGFGGWSGTGCAGAGDCVLSLEAATTVTATFSRVMRALTVNVVGTGGVGSAPAGIACPTDCVESLAQGTVVTLAAAPSAGHIFSGWSGGGCTGSGACAISLTVDTTVTATFTPITNALTVQALGVGSVSSAPAGITCPADCGENYAPGTQVTLTATPTAGNSFSGWAGGGCTDTGACVLSVNAATAVTATFTPITHALTVTTVGNGVVVATGINCGADCSEAYPQGTPVSLTAAPSAGYSIEGWSGGGCSGTGGCVVTMNAATTVTATFTQIMSLLTVSKSGTGTVTASGIACGADCSEAYPQGTVVTLTAAPGAGFSFSGWSGGACTGAGSCGLTINAATTVTANFVPEVVNQHALNVSLLGPAGAGAVTSTPAGISCGQDCTESFAQGSAVTLRAVAAANHAFVGWSGGGCNGVGDCVVTMNAATTVSATFQATVQRLTVNVAGSGTVLSVPAGINCAAAACVADFAGGSTVTLAASPAAGWAFGGWSGGGCSGTGACTVTMNVAASVTATFNPITHVLTIAKAGSGTVTGTGIDCGTDCSEAVVQGSSITLIATPGAGHVFAGWSGSCTGTANCVVTMNAAATVTATFNPITHVLTVAKVGSGTVTGTGIDCGGDCTEAVVQGTAVTLAATPGAGYVFAGWSGGCAGTGSCVVTMNAATSVTATFVQVTHLLTVTKVGSGAVTGVGIDCGLDCTEAVTQGTAVTLNAAPGVGYSFAGWSVGCTGTALSCVVTMNVATTVTATFAQITHALTVTKVGNGSVTGTGIDCGADCTETVAQGATVALTATPDVGFSFAGWSGGGCAGTSACTVTINAATTVTATFSQITHPLTVAKVGSGTVAGTGIDCGNDCSETYVEGTLVTLTAVPSAGSGFAGWSGGGCSGTGGCVVTMSAATTVTATFTQITHVLTINVVGGGGVGSAPAGITCPTDCTEAYPQGSLVTLAAVPVAGYSFAGWSGGGCSGTGGCVVTMGAVTSVTATFSQSGEFGLASRPQNSSCFAFDPPSISTASLTLTDAFPSMPTFGDGFVGLYQAPGDSTRWFAMLKDGVVRVFDNTPNVNTSSVFIDITDQVFTAGDQEAGLLGLAFDPNFGSGAGKNRNVYLSYSGVPQPGNRLRATVSRFTASVDLRTLDKTTEVKLLGVNKQESYHNGGHIAFGPDGLLYIGLGDGGGEPSLNVAAQDDRYLLGKMLRIDVTGSTGGAPYRIPSDNPFAGNATCHDTGVGSAACPEVFAKGFRNPWRWSFDKLNGRLWLGDVGWQTHEEVNVVTRGGNYGWPITEGSSCVSAGCDKTGLTEPVLSLPRDDAYAITGGFVYRGSQTTDLWGQYLFGDFGSTLVGALISGAGGSYTYRQLLAPYSSSSTNMSSFAEANDGELYIVDYSLGRIRKLVYSVGSGGGGPAVPNLLSATGCVNPSDPKLPAAGVVPYDINAPFWSDNAVKDRWFALPGSTAAFTADAGGDWIVPPRGVVIKHFRLGGQLIETRLLMRQLNGDWAGYSYEWNDAQTDATLVARAGKDKTIAGQTWSYPSRSQCLQCHTSAAGFSLGLETAQLNRSIIYPQTGILANQLATLSAPSIAMLTPQITDPAAQPKYADPLGADSVGPRARAWLHSNCAMCHRPGGTTPTALNFLHTTPLAGTNTCNVDPTKGSLGITGAKIIAPGDPDRSVLVSRIASRDGLIQMPPLGSHLADANGVALIRQWIAQLASCN